MRRWRRPACSRSRRPPERSSQPRRNCRQLRAWAQRAVRQRCRQRREGLWGAEQQRALRAADPSAQRSRRAVPQPLGRPPRVARAPRRQRLRREARRRRAAARMQLRPGRAWPWPARRRRRRAVQAKRARATHAAPRTSCLPQQAHGLGSRALVVRRAADGQVGLPQEGPGSKRALQGRGGSGDAPRQAAGDAAVVGFARYEQEHRR